MVYKILNKIYTMVVKMHYEILFDKMYIILKQY